MNITIKSANNGFILTYPNPNDEGEITEVIECPSDYRSDPAALQKLQGLLYVITDALGYYGSKHDEYRLRVIVERQHVPENLVDAISKLDEVCPEGHHVILEKW